MRTKQDTNSETTKSRSKGGWFNWYVNRGRLSLVTPRSKASESEHFKQLRSISNRRAI